MLKMLTRRGFKLFKVIPTKNGKLKVLQADYISDVCILSRHGLRNDLIKIFALILENFVKN